MSAPVGPELRAIRQQLGWSLQRLEDKSDGRFKGVVVGSWERGDRHPPVESVRDLLAFYGGWRLEILGPGDVNHHSSDVESGAVTRWSVAVPQAGRIDCADRGEAQRIAAAIPFAKVGYRLVGPVHYEEPS